MLYFASLKKSLHLFPLGRGQFQPCFKKYFAVCKNLLTYSHWEKPNAHPKSQKIFYPYTYLELRSRNAPCFYKNFEKIFSIEGLDSACSKSPFTYSHWEEANSNPVSKNILLFAKPLHLFGIRRLKRNLFFKKTEKIPTKRPVKPLCGRFVLERVTRLELATFCLGSRRSTRWAKSAEHLLF